MSKNKIVAIVILVVSFALSLTLFLINDSRYSRITFKFHHEIKNKIVLEDRYVLLKGDKNKKAKMVVDELFLGPISVFNHKLVPMDMTYNLFYINGKIAYLDLPLKFVTEFNEKDYTIEEAVSLIKENLLKNISGLKSVILTIDGETMGVGPSTNILPQVE